CANGVYYGPDFW
nr:immunoglobulin heavy chain junction region [Macaca mulatta]MOV39084.1 immunoglobulin heavy chain junction region [Macaca mulatta]MOV39302.1 immunoglobulin heavy chain junction region [Macaca mulatta]MOV39786.1 immunoglobulin heavy chain junction region [Macaca mulatta]MOV39798.1 immunoglobulin heavy chain junction region [Macaca mulatta]